MASELSEIQIKNRRLAEFLDRHRLDGVLLTQRPNFAWITCGGDNFIANNSLNGVASILATPRSRVCFTSSIECRRFGSEELARSGIEVVDHPWYDNSAAKAKLKELIAGRKIAADLDDTGEYNRFGAGLVRLPADFVTLRWSLTSQEIARYREGAKRTSQAIEAACRQIRRRSTEHEIAGVLEEQVRARGLLPVVTLVAADARIEKYRHPIPTDNKLQRYCMLVICASFGGLISNMTRFVSFARLPEALKKKQQAVVNVDAAVNLATKPGRTLGEIFKVIEQAYADNGFPGEYANHHQGGSTGYAGREVFAVPGMRVQVLENQAFAWNPSMKGVKSEDTMLCSSRGIEFLTAMSNAWPKLTARVGDQSVKRPDILMR